MSASVRSARAVARAMLLICGGLLAGPGIAAGADQVEPGWKSLFNGRNLSGWTPKITGHAPGDNYADTFRVEDGLLKVSYDGYEQFGSRFGHLFYATPFSYYRLVIEYRFVGVQAPEAPGDWAVRNSGVMIHAQAPETMARGQSFPVSVEVQFLGGLGDGEPRPTANVCTPGTEIVHAGRIQPEHCLSSSSATFDGDGWVQMEVIVLGAARITHKVNGETVLSYTLPQIGGAGMETLDDRAGELLDGGYIALQSESHPIEFRKVELLDLEGCIDPAAANYQPYVVRSRPKACRYATAE